MKELPPCNTIHVEMPKTGFLSDYITALSVIVPQNICVTKIIQQVLQLIPVISVVLVTRADQWGLEITLFCHEININVDFIFPSEINTRKCIHQSTESQKAKGIYVSHREENGYKIPLTLSSINIRACHYRSENRSNSHKQLVRGLEM